MYRARPAVLAMAVCCHVLWAIASTFINALVAAESVHTTREGGGGGRRPDDVSGATVSAVRAQDAGVVSGARPAVVALAVCCHVLWAIATKIEALIMAAPRRAGGGNCWRGAWRRIAGAAVGAVVAQSGAATMVGAWPAIVALAISVDVTVMVVKAVVEADGTARREIRKSWRRRRRRAGGRRRRRRGWGGRRRRRRGWQERRWTRRWEGEPSAWPARQ